MKNKHPMKIKHLLSNLEGTSIFHLSIKKGIEEDKHQEVIKMIKDQLKDNRKLVTSMIGEEIVFEIENGCMVESVDTPS